MRIAMHVALMLVVLPSTALAQKAIGPAPLPAPLLAGHKVFLSNLGADPGLFPHPFSGDTARVYNTMYADLVSDGTYTLTQSPAEADLVFEVQLQAPKGSLAGEAQPAKAAGTADPFPTVRLTIYDRPSHYVLWTITESVEAATLQKSHDRNLDMAVAAAVSDLKMLLAPAHP